MIIELNLWQGNQQKDLELGSLQVVTGDFPEYLPGELPGCTWDLGGLGQGGGEGDVSVVFV